MSQIEIFFQFLDGKTVHNKIDAKGGTFHFKVTAGCLPIIAVAVKAPGSKIGFIMPGLDGHKMASIPNEDLAARLRQIVPRDDNNGDAVEILTEVARRLDPPSYRP